MILFTFDSFLIQTTFWLAKFGFALQKRPKVTAKIEFNQLVLILYIHVSIEMKQRQITGKHFSQSNILYEQSDRLPRWQVNGLWRLLVEELVKETDVGKRPSGHDSVITPTRAVRVVVSWDQTAKRQKVEQELLKASCTEDCTFSYWGEESERYRWQEISTCTKPFLEDSQTVRLKAWDYAKYNNTTPLSPTVQSTTASRSVRSKC